jgi:hypothetical protein
VDEVEAVVGEREALEHIPVREVVVGRLGRLAGDQVEADHHRTREAPSFRPRATVALEGLASCRLRYRQGVPCQWRDDCFRVGESGDPVTVPVGLVKS